MNINNSIELEKIDFVFIHKDRDLLAAFAWLADDLAKKVMVYSDQQQFLAHAHQYLHDTKIVLGRTFRDGEPSGIQLASHLHALGFKRLYLLTFTKTFQRELPDYLINIPGEDCDGFTRIFLEE